MKENKIKILINKPRTEVFEFIINPKNTSLWFTFIVEETADLPIALGSKYINFNTNRQKGTYIVAEFEPPAIFQLDSLDTDYKVRYALKEISKNETELEYFEWVEAGDLQDPCGVEILENLKSSLS